ncbi:MAG TPA: hypothetical protein VIF62_25975 [Labilithrix sp.]
MKSLFRSVVACAVLASAALSSPAQADDPQVARLLGAKDTMRWNTPIGGDRYGHAEALVDAPADVVAKRAAEFNHYKELHRKFQTARVIAKEGDTTDVYMRYPVRIGPMTFELHEVMRFQATKQVGAAYVIEATGVKGDMSKGRTIIRVKPVDDKHSILEVDVLLVPQIPAPQSFIDEELRDGAFDFVNGLRDRSQPQPGPVTQL